MIDPLRDEMFKALDDRVQADRAKRAKANGNGATIVPDMPRLVSLRDFLKDFKPPDYLIEGIIQRRYIYSLTGQTGHAKTAIALLIAQLVGSLDAGAMLCGHAVERGRVVYFAGENPDDIRMRLIGANVDLNSRISIIPGVFDIEAMGAELIKQIDGVQPIDLVFIDTSAAYFLGNEELSNTQMGAHARMLRKLTTLPGGPSVLPLCHPIKHVTDPSQLLPRGGGAFLNEMDGNLTAWLKDEMVQLHHNKIRGPGFEPMTFQLERITSTKLIDSKGRLLPTVKAVPISEEEEAKRTQDAEKDEDKMLAALAENPNRSFAKLAEACGWMWKSGEPAKSKVERVLGELKAAKLVKKVRRRWELTDEGCKAAPQLSLIKGAKLKATGCASCGNAYGKVFTYRSGDAVAALHEDCAEAWFREQETVAK